MRKLIVLLLTLTIITPVSAQGSRPAISADNLSQYTFLTALVGQVGDLNIVHLEFSPDNRYLLVEYDGAVKSLFTLWDVHTYATTILDGSNNGGQFLLNGRRLMWFSDATFHLWTLDDKPAEMLTIENASIRVTLGTTLVAVQSDQGVDIVDLVKGAIQSHLSTQKLPDSSWFSPDEHFMVMHSGGNFDTYDTTTGQLVTPIADGAIPTYSPDRKYVAWLLADKLVLRSVTGEKSLLETSIVPPEFPALSDAPQWFVFSPDSNILAFHAADGRVTLFNIATGQQHTLDATQNAIIFSQDSSMLWTYQTDNYTRRRVRFWSAETGKLIAGDDDFEALLYAISPDEQTAILQVYHTHPSLVFINLQTGERSAELPLGDLDTSVTDPPPQFTQDGRSFVMFEDKTLGTWDLQTKEVARFKSKRGQIYGLKIAPDSHTAMLTYEDGSELRDLTGKGQPVKISNGYSSLRGPRVSPDFTLVAVPMREIVWLYGIPTPNDPPARIAIPALIVPTSVTLYAKPALNAPVLGQISGSGIVTGQNAQHDFVYIHGEDGSEGWVHYSSSRVSMPPEAKSIALPVIKN